MRKAVSLVTATIVSAVFSLSALLWRSRARLPYNEEGRYFDATHTVVYDVDSLELLKASTLLLALLAAGAIVWAIRAWRK